MGGRGRSGAALTADAKKGPAALALSPRPAGRWRVAGEPPAHPGPRPSGLGRPASPVESPEPRREREVLDLVSDSSARPRWDAHVRTAGRGGRARSGCHQRTPVGRRYASDLQPGAEAGRGAGQGEGEAWDTCPEARKA